MDFSEGVPLSSYTTLGLGGAASRFATIESEANLVEALSSRLPGEPFLVLGGGSNLVVSDAGFEGLVLHLVNRGIRVLREEPEWVCVEVSAGESLDHFVETCVRVGYSGLEALSGIPGTVGATPIQNVGAYGAEISDCLVRLRYYDIATGEFPCLERDACDFRYRSSCLRGDASRIVTSVEFCLSKNALGAPIRYLELARHLNCNLGDQVPASEQRAAVLSLRRKKGMVLDPSDADTRSAGSFFVNPVVSSDVADQVAQRAKALGIGAALPRFSSNGAVKLPAAWLIEQSGFTRGYQKGRAGISHKHALALVCLPGGTTDELLLLAREIRQGVFQSFGIWLSPEPLLIGCSV